MVLISEINCVSIKSLFKMHFNYHFFLHCYCFEIKDCSQNKLILQDSFDICINLLNIFLQVSCKSKERSSGSPSMSSSKNSRVKSTSSINPQDSISSINQMEPISLPGTPLSNSSAISRSSDASVSSASSTRALLFAHPTQCTEGSSV